VVWTSRAHLPAWLTGARSGGERPARREEEAVLVTYRLPAGLDPSLAPEVPVLERSVERALRTRHTGELEGLQPGPGTLTVLAYGSDADRLWASIEAAARTFPCRPARVTLRYGLVGAPDRTLPL
jgi:hypothetical protein